MTLHTIRTRRLRAVQAISCAEPWQDFELDDVEVRELGRDIALLTCRARATRSGGDVYRALVSTVYRKAGATWLLLVHQQTPLQAM